MNNNDYIIKEILKNEKYKDALIFAPKQDNPITLQYRDINDANISTKKYKKSINEVLWEILRWNYDLRKNLTRQQIHTEKGKVKRSNYSEIINFLVKRGISKEFIDNEINQEREDIILSINYGCTKLTDSKLGIIKIKE